MLTAPQLEMLVQVSRSAREGVIGCDDCYEQLARFAELTLIGKGADEAMPLVREHLDGCPECREEFEAFMSALQESDKPRRSWWLRMLGR